MIRGSEKWTKGHIGILEEHPSDKIWWENINVVKAVVIIEKYRHLDRSVHRSSTTFGIAFLGRAMCVLKHPEGAKHTLTAKTSHPQEGVTRLMSVGIRLVILLAQLNVKIAAKDALEEINELENSVVGVRHSSSASFHQ
jgi:hypothetical protein